MYLNALLGSSKMKVKQRAQQEEWVSFIKKNIISLYITCMVLS